MKQNKQMNQIDNRIYCLWFLKISKNNVAPFNLLLTFLLMNSTGCSFFSNFRKIIFNVFNHKNGDDWWNQILYSVYSLIFTHFPTEVSSSATNVNGGFHGDKMVKVSAFQVYVIWCTYYFASWLYFPLFLGCRKYPHLFTYKKQKNGSYEYGGVAKDILDDAKINLTRGDGIYRDYIIKYRWIILCIMRAV